eukprot:TRINITY_DN1996_c0_g1_i7.p1 TRINITY_DN1996_c0_g1~~TRINITY_DN1996_c0_g1_i7.p1  ORF type:complete len:369 (-),score=90.19 TRINITY_DN1996_c0_g1_i7:111-1217(-)
MNKEIIIACINCNKNHKKCDNIRPCTHCKKKNIECIENMKRKPNGRPRKNDNKNQKRKILIERKEVEEGIICIKCEFHILDSNSKFCSNCGNKVPEKIGVINKQLIKENNILKRRNNILTRLIELRDPYSSMWMMVRFDIPNDGILLLPEQSFVAFSSFSLNELLGCNLTNMYFPNLVPQKHHIIIPNQTFEMDIEYEEGSIVPKMYGDAFNWYVKHSKGHLIGVDAKYISYFDSSNKEMTYGMIIVERIRETQMKEENIGPLDLEKTTTKFSGPLNKGIPDYLKLYKWNYKNYPKNVLNYQEQNSPLCDSFSDNSGNFGSSYELDNSENDNNNNNCNNNSEATKDCSGNNKIPSFGISNLTIIHIEE